MNMMMLPATPGTCAMCATEHDDHTPHNYWSVFYQMRFRLKYGRDATHADCMQHLSAEWRTMGYEAGKVKNMPELVADFERMRNEYRKLLEENGKQWTDTDSPIAEPVAVSEP